LPILQKALETDGPVVIDVPMKNNPTPTTGHWNILDIYSPDADVSHEATD
jgi:acetolactate synthase-1/2/3 large subunit